MNKIYKSFIVATMLSVMPLAFAAAPVSTKFLNRTDCYCSMDQKALHCTTGDSKTVYIGYMDGKDFRANNGSGLLGITTEPKSFTSGGNPENFAISNGEFVQVNWPVVNTRTGGMVVVSTTIPGYPHITMTSIPIFFKSDWAQWLSTNSCPK